MKVNARNLNNTLPKVILYFLCASIPFILTAKRKTELSDTTKKDYFLYMSATYEYLKGNIPKALSSYKKLLSDEKIPSSAYEGYIKLLFDLNQFQEVIKIQEEKAQETFKDNLEIQIIFALSCLNLNQTKKAEKIFSSLLKKYPDDEQVAYYATVANIKNNKLDKALQFIAKCVGKETLKSKHFIFHFLESKIYLQMGMPQKALEAINKSLEKYTNFGRGWLLKALLEEQLGKVNEAINGYKNFLHIVGRDPAVEKQLVFLLFKAGRLQEAANLLRKKGGGSPQDFFDLAIIEWKLDNYDAALHNVNKTLEKLPQFKRAKMLKIEILLAKNQKQEVLDLLQNWLKSEPEDNSVVHLLLLLKKVSIPRDQIIKVLETVLKDTKNCLGILSALTDLYLEDESYNRALTSCNKLLNIVNNEEFKSKILFQIGFIYFITNKEDKVEKPLREAMKYKPTYPSVYNLLAYFYAKNDKNLPEALEFSELALKSDPNCYYYLDTKGFVLLKLGNIEKAIEFLEKALNLSLLSTGQQDKIILEHLQKAKILKT